MDLEACVEDEMSGADQTALLALLRMAVTPRPSGADCKIVSMKFSIDFEFLILILILNLKFYI